MTLIAMGLGTRKAPEGANLDPAESFWSFLSAFPALLCSNSEEDFAGDPQGGHQMTGYGPTFKLPKRPSIILSGLKIRADENKKLGLLIGGEPNDTDAGIIKIGRRYVLVSNSGKPESLTLEASPLHETQYAIVVYVDTQKPDAEHEQPGTPEYVKVKAVNLTVVNYPDRGRNIREALPDFVGENYLDLGDAYVPKDATTVGKCKPATPAPDMVKDFFTGNCKRLLKSANQYREVASTLMQSAKDIKDDYNKAKKDIFDQIDDKVKKAVDDKAQKDILNQIDDKVKKAVDEKAKQFGQGGGSGGGQKQKFFGEWDTFLFSITGGIDLESAPVAFRSFSRRSRRIRDKDNPSNYAQAERSLRIPVSHKGARFLIHFVACATSQQAKLWEYTLECVGEHNGAFWGLDCWDMLSDKITDDAPVWVEGGKKEFKLNYTRIIEIDQDMKSFDLRLKTRAQEGNAGGNSEGEFKSGWLTICEL